MRRVNELVLFTARTRGCVEFLVMCYETLKQVQGDDLLLNALVIVFYGTK